jgi:hypothetical protein
MWICRHHRKLLEHAIVIVVALGLVGRDLLHQRVEDGGVRVIWCIWLGEDGGRDIGHVLVDQLNDGLGGAIVRYVVFGGETGETIGGGIAALCGRDDSWCKATLICGLNEGTEVKVCFVGLWFALLIVHIARVDAQTREEVDDIHEQLLHRVWHLGNDTN